MRIAVGMSGGVDSSVAAALLKEQGHDVFGVFLHFWSEPAVGKYRDNVCCSVEAQEDARRVCRELGIVLRVINMERPFKKKVVDYFNDEYRNGRTPNPCIYCNQFIKFGELLRKAQTLGAEAIATGHYARTRLAADGTVKLLKAVDTEKDQTYFLHQLSQGQLRHVFFPVGDYYKKEVRELAAHFHLPVAAKKESQEVCFVARNDLADFLRRHLSLRPGKIYQAETGEELGEHAGAALYTLGQRQGLALAGGPWFVTKIDVKKNALYVSRDAGTLHRQELVVSNLNWISGKVPPLPLKAVCRVRYRAAEIPAMVQAGTGKYGDYLINLEQSERAITPGQFAVLWQGDECLGGGEIANFE